MAKGIDSTSKSIDYGAYADIHIQIREFYTSRNEILMGEKP